MDIIVLLGRHAKKSTQRYPLVTQGHDVDKVVDPLGKAVSILIKLPEWV